MSGGFYSKNYVGIRQGKFSIERRQRGSDKRKEGLCKYKEVMAGYYKGVAIGGS